MRELRSGIPSKIADATCTVINGLGKFFRSNPFLIPDLFPVCPILAEKAIKGTSVIKDCEVFITVLWV
jgi:hypothetical protein